MCASIAAFATRQIAGLGRFHFKLTHHPSERAVFCNRADRNRESTAPIRRIVRGLSVHAADEV
jgi:hypothetical protein